jgi:hypothetical protein
MSDFFLGFLWGKTLSNNSNDTAKSEEAGRGAGAGIVVFLALAIAPYIVLAHTPVIAVAFAFLQRWLCYLFSRFFDLLFDGMSSTHGGLLNTYMIYKRMLGQGCSWEETYILNTGPRGPIMNTDIEGAGGAGDAAFTLFHNALNVARCDTIQFNWIGLITGTFVCALLCYGLYSKVETFFAEFRVYWWSRHVWRVALWSTFFYWVIDQTGMKPIGVVISTICFFVLVNLCYYGIEDSSPVTSR